MNQSCLSKQCFVIHTFPENWDFSSYLLFKDNRAAMILNFRNKLFWMYEHIQLFLLLFIPFYLVRGRLGYFSQAGEDCHAAPSIFSWNLIVFISGCRFSLRKFPDQIQRQGIFFPGFTMPLVCWCSECSARGPAIWRTISIFWWLKRSKISQGTYFFYYWKIWLPSWNASRKGGFVIFFKRPDQQDFEI